MQKIFDPVSWPQPNGMTGIRVMLDSGMVITFHMFLEKEPSESQLYGLKSDIERLMKGEKSPSELLSFTRELIARVKSNDIERCYYYCDKVPAESRVAAISDPLFKKAMTVLGFNHGT